MVNLSWKEINFPLEDRSPKHTNGNMPYSLLGSIVALVWGAVFERGNKGINSSIALCRLTIANVGMMKVFREGSAPSAVWEDEPWNSVVHPYLQTENLVQYVLRRQTSPTCRNTPSIQRRMFLTTFYLSFAWNVCWKHCILLSLVCSQPPPALPPFFSPAHWSWKLKETTGSLLVLL